MKIYTDEEIAKKINKKHTVKKVASIIIYPVFIVFLICSVLVILQIITNPNKTPNLFGYKVFNVISGSMAPRINIGDVIIIKETEIGELKQGDIITFKQEGNVVTHRIVNIIEENGMAFQTKGDHNNAKDEMLVYSKDIEGRYVCKIPKVGTLIHNIKNTTTMLIIILIMYLIYNFLQMKDDRETVRREKRKERENK